MRALLLVLDSRLQRTASNQHERSKRHLRFRSEVSIGARYYGTRGNIGGAIGYSEENDYRAKYVSMSGSRNFNNDLTTLTVSLSHSDDSIFPRTLSALIACVMRTNRQVRWQ